MHVSTPLHAPATPNSYKHAAEKSRQQMPTGSEFSETAPAGLLSVSMASSMLTSNITNLCCAVLILVHSAANLQANTNANANHRTDDEKRNQQFDQKLLPLRQI